MLAIPTTAGTGSECTRNAVISSNPGETPGFKKSLRADSMVPRIALVDPEVTVSLPADLTARTGMDAITQLIEARLSCRARPIPSALAAEGLAQALPGIERAVADPTDQAARCAMSHAAYLSGIALANSGLGVAHGVAAALGIVAGVPHGLACAVLLPVALEANRQVRTREVAEFGRLLRAQPFACDAEAAEWAPAGVRELNARLGIPATLGALGVRAEQLPELVRQSHGNSLSGNPRPIPDDELGAILEALL
jgi:alcohol dehydrogenase class IV